VVDSQVVYHFMKLQKVLILIQLTIQLNVSICFIQFVSLDMGKRLEECCLVIHVSSEGVVPAQRLIHCKHKCGQVVVVHVTSAFYVMLSPRILETTKHVFTQFHLRFIPRIEVSIQDDGHEQVQEHNLHYEHVDAVEHTHQQQIATPHRFVSCLNEVTVLRAFNATMAYLAVVSAQDQHQVLPSFSCGYSEHSHHRVEERLEVIIGRQRGFLLYVSEQVHAYNCKYVHNQNQQQAYVEHTGHRVNCGFE
jgi:hypothetical protein